jgi:tetratricopeptide (TPR) repeat protein
MMNDTMARGFAEQHGDALMLNSTLETGFFGVSNQLGRMTAAFNAGLERLHGAVERMSADICGRLDAMHDTLKNPLRTQARELYTRATERYTRGLFEEALKDVKAAVEKDETDYLSWILLGNVYLFGAGEFSNVVDLDKAIEALTNAAKYISPDIMTQEARTKEIYRALEPYSGEDLIKEMEKTGGVPIWEAQGIWDACGGNTEAISRRLAGLNIPDRLAAEIYFYLALAKYYKSNDLTLGKAEGEAKPVLGSALQAFNRSLGYSDRMLESRYNSARCRTLLGDTEGALKDLEAAIKGDRNYALKVLADSDFDGLSKDVIALMERIRNETYLKAKDALETLRARLADTVFLGGTFSDMIQKMASEWIPQSLGAELPYFDLLNVYGRLQTMLAWLTMEYYPCDRQVAVDTSVFKDKYIGKNKIFEKLHNESIVLEDSKRVDSEEVYYYQLLGYKYTTIMRSGKITLTDAGRSNPLGKDSGKFKGVDQIDVLYRGGMPKKDLISMDSLESSSFFASSPVWRFAYFFDKSKDSEHQGFGFYHVNDKTFSFQIDEARYVAAADKISFQNPVAVFLNKETLMVFNVSDRNIKIFQPGLISRGEFEAVEQRERQIAAEEARRKAEEAKRVEEDRRRTEEARRRAEEEQAARDAAERARYKRQFAIWRVLRIMFGIFFAAFAANMLRIYLPLYIASEGDVPLKDTFIILVLFGCVLGGVFGAGGLIAGPVAGVMAGIIMAKIEDAGVGTAIFGVIVMTIVVGGPGCVAGLIAGGFYDRLKKILKAELKLEPRAAPVSGGGTVMILAPAAGTVLRYAVNEGAQVKAGDTVLIIESMKMELEIKAAAGKVHFLVPKGTQVVFQQPVAEVL